MDKRKMNGTRLARATRCRFIIYLGILVLIMGMVAIFHNSQMQLDETRQQRLHCEQQQGAMNDRLTSLVEEKIHLERKHEQEQNEDLQQKHDLEQHIKDLEEELEKNKIQSQRRCDKLEQSYKLLQNKHENWVSECTQTKKQQLDNINMLEKKIHTLHSELHKEKETDLSEMNIWKEKYNIMDREKRKIEQMLKDTRAKFAALEINMNHLESSLKQYQTNCHFKPSVQDWRKLESSLSPIRNQEIKEIKTFTKQESISESVNHITDIAVENIPTDTYIQSKKQFISSKPTENAIVSSSSKNLVYNFQLPKFLNNTDSKTSGHSIINDPNRLQVTPLGAPKTRNLNTSSTNNIYQPKVLGFFSNSSLAKPLIGQIIKNFNPLVQNSRKLPDNVAPIPDNFEKLLDKNQDVSSKVLSDSENNIIGDDQQVKSHLFKNAPIEYDILKATEDIRDDDLKFKSKPINDKLIQNSDDNEKIENNERNGELELKDELNGQKNEILNHNNMKRNNQQIVDVDNLHNEVAADQGKEFADGLRLDEGYADDGDDDDYSIPGARKQEDQAIRH